jgi:DNA polymerase-3 subunit gamma/tau
MLGLADRGRIRRLLEHLLSGDAGLTLAELDDAHELGIDPTSLVRGLMEELHLATRVKAGAAAGALPVEQREAAVRFADQLTWGQIHRLWQMLLKGLSDVQIAPDPREAAAMALLRLIHAANLPDPAAVLSRLSGEAAATSVPAAAPARTADAPTTDIPVDFPAMVKLLEAHGRHQIAVQLHDQVGLVRYAPPELVLKPARPLGGDWPRELAAALKSVTGTSWEVSLSDEPGEPSLLDQEKMAEERVRADVLADPSVRAAFEAFPDATLETFTVTKGP